MANCWLAKTPHQTALLLMLMVIIPFVIGMIAVYVLGVMTDNGDCEKFCHVLTETKPNPAEAKLMRTGNISAGDTGGMPRSDDDGQASTDLPSADLDQDDLERRKYQYTVDPKSRGSKLEAVCAKDIKSPIRYPYIVSIIQTLYNDNNGINGIKYVCSGTIISEKWVITSSECFGQGMFNINLLDVLYVRAGSPFWSKDGVLHEIKQIIHPPVRDSILSTSPTVIALEVKHAFLRTPAIKPIKISNKSTYRDRIEGDVFSWRADDNIPFPYRKKFETLHARSLELYKDNDCSLFKKRRSVFCGEDINPTDFCDYSKGSPVIKDDYLIGIHIGHVCSTGKSEHYFTDIVHYYKWLRVSTKFHII